MQASLKGAALAVMAFASAQAMATGFVNLPTTGFAISGGTTAYTLCNTTGDFGSDDSIPPTTGANNTCAIFTQNPPLSGYTKTASTTRNIVMNNTYTNNTNVTVGTVVDEVWRSSTNCIYSTKVNLTNTDYDKRATSPGTQYFEVNDIARAGFSGRTVDIAYFFTANSDDVLYRAGRTFTSVPHPVGAADQPLTTPAPPAGTAISTNGAAALSANWVDFTTDVNFFDDDGSSLKNSSRMFIKTTCTTATPTALTGAIRLRQTGQEGQPLIEVSLPGYAPAGSNTNP